ncbi:MAG: shikimate dehydrogenase family protein, partial [Acidimicrobiia bacterium]
MAGVIGDPVEHSRSPAMHNAAFTALGLDWVYVAFHVPAGSGATAVRAVLDLGLVGLNATMPHKSAAASACDHLASEASTLDAVNTVVVDGDRLIGHNTDGAGFLRALADEGVAVDGKRCLVLGAGGAARAITLALGVAGAIVTVAARRE